MTLEGKITGWSGTTFAYVTITTEDGVEVRVMMKADDPRLELFERRGQPVTIALTPWFVADDKTKSKLPAGLRWNRALCTEAQ